MSHDYNSAAPYCDHLDCRRETVAELELLADRCALTDDKRMEIMRALLIARTPSVAVRCRRERKPRPGFDGRSHAPLPPRTEEIDFYDKTALVAPGMVWRRP